MFAGPALLVAGFLTLAGSAAALESGGTARAVEIVDGDTLVLDDDRQVRLVGIQAPKLPLGQANFVAWPLADEAKALLERLEDPDPIVRKFSALALKNFVAIPEVKNALAAQMKSDPNDRVKTIIQSVLTAEVREQ